ncbi:MAG: cobalamin-dependent protein [Deltaproteobacteria bacterium]|nr:cobalamin-dependent protein [Deltaproteobacteria bacterium]
MSEKLVDTLVNMKEQEALEIAKELIESGEDPLEILGSCSKAMEVVGEYFLPQLVMAGEMLRQISEMLKPKLKGAVQSERLGKVVIGTVKGDLHDIGKDIVVFMLDVNGFDVMDLGIDVPPDKFVDAIKEFQPEVVGLSGFLTLAFDSMKETVDAIRDANLRDKVKIMIGGGQIDDEIRRYTEADAYGLNAMDAVTLSRGWIGGS